MKKVAILAAGNGTRIQLISPHKPITKINGVSLLEIVVNNFLGLNFKDICIIFNEDEKNMDKSSLTCLKRPEVSHFYKSTQSSLHSLFEISRNTSFEKHDHHIIISMVDSLISKKDLANFANFCETLRPDQSAIVVTSYIEDEMPLTVKVNKRNEIESFDCPIENGTFVTSGVYCFSTQIFPIVSLMVNRNEIKLRNLLKELIHNNFTIKSFYVNKSLDIDRPEDVISAEKFLNDITI
jgi:choline kinase